MALDDDDMTTPPAEPDSGTPADRAAGSLDEDEFLGRGGGADGGAGDGGADSGADGGADGGAGDGGADGGADSGAGGTDPTTEAEEDTRFA